MFKIEVRNEKGKKEVFERENLMTIDYLHYLELLERIEPMGQLEGYQEQLEFLANLFPGLTVDQLSNGTTTTEMNKIWADLMLSLLGNDSDPKQVE